MFPSARCAPELRAALAQAMTRGFSCETLIVEPGERQEGYCDRWGVVISAGGDQALAAVWASRWLEKHGIETCTAICGRERADVAELGDKRAIVVLRSFVIGD